MGLTGEQWDEFQAFLLNLYRLRSLQEIQRQVMEFLGKMIPHTRSFFDLATVKDDAIIFFKPFSLNIPDEALEAYYANYQQKDYTIWNFSEEEPMVYLDSQVLPDVSREKSRIYQEWMKPLSAHYGLGCTIVKAHFYGSITLFRSKENVDFSRNEYQLLTMLNQHLASHLNMLWPNGIREEDFRVSEKYSLQKYHLTPRETNIVEQLLYGCTNQEIGERLCISEATVKKHMGHIFTKLQVTNRGQLLVKIRSGEE